MGRPMFKYHPYDSVIMIPLKCSFKWLGSKKKKKPIEPTLDINHDKNIFTKFSIFLEIYRVI